MIYVYALTDPLDAPPAGETGIAEAPLEVVAQRGVGAVVSACGAPPAPDPDSLWRHECVAEAVMRRAAVLPTRFGTTLADASRLRVLLTRNQPDIRTALEHVRGCVEVGVRLLAERSEASAEVGRPDLRPGGTDGASAGTGAGRAYLLCRLAEERRRRAPEGTVDAVADDVHTALAEGARDAVRRPARGPGVFTAAYLIERARLAGFVDMVRNLDAAHGDRQILCTGPWPPYSFVPTLDLEGSLSA